jgi:class 3 adenylate cyclase
VPGAYDLALWGGRPPSGTVTFLFTDVEGSTRRWESDPETMRAALVLHDEVLLSAIAAHGGLLFKHTGDGVCAAFGSARAAVDAALGAQQMLGLPVRMGLATGEAECRGEDYFGPVLIRAARVMAAGHGGQILVAASTASVVSGVDLIDRGEHRLRELSGVERACTRCAPPGCGSISRLCGRWMRCRGTSRCRRPVSLAATSR